MENKLCFGEGGAGKAPEVATQAFQEKVNISDFLERSFGDEIDKIFVCAGAGGGTGAGSVVSAVRSAVKYNLILRPLKRLELF